MLNQEQAKVVYSTENRIVVLSAVATGKTHVLTERVRHLIREGVDPYKIVAITFTNAAAEEMRIRLEDDYKDGLTISTIHSYANQLLTRHGVSTSNIIQEEEFDEFFALIKKHPECIEEVEHLLLDEAQDTGKEQIEFLLNMVKPKNYFLIGDLRQSIYGFNSARPDLIERLTNSWDVTTYQLNNNYRNGRKILQYAKAIISQTGRVDNSIPMRKESGIVIEKFYNEKYLVDMIKTNDDFKDWFVLTRSNMQLNDIHYVLEKNGIPCSTFKRKDLTFDEINDIMKKNTVKVLTIHTSKGLQAKNVAVIGAQMYNAEETRVSYVAATRAENMLIWMMKPKRGF